MLRRLLLLPLVLLFVNPAGAGLHYSDEAMADLPSQWRGFLLDHRGLRLIAIPGTENRPASPQRTRYEQEANRLEKLGQERKLTADESADLGAIRIRLGELDRAVEVLRPAQREHSLHYRLTSNLAMAWHLLGELDQAEELLRQAVRLAPGKFLKAEQLHLKLVQLRKREEPGTQKLDDLFGVRFVGPEGKYQPGQLARSEQKKLPADAVAQVQQLALWLPADGRLLWLMAELAAASGDVATAAAMMDGCTIEFNMRDADLREHRQATRAAADTLARSGVGRTEHEGHFAVKPRSSRPLVNRVDRVPLPPIDPKGVNRVPWVVVTETTVDNKYRPTFPKYLRELEGAQVKMTGFMQPLGEELESAAFMLIEYPIGCWYCEMPEITGIVLVEMPSNESQSYSRGLLTVTGRLQLNASDPENFLYIVRDAKVEAAN